MEKEREGIPFVEACHKMKLDYLPARKLLLCGELEGWQDPRSRRWYVDAQSVERYLANSAVSPRAA